MADSSRRIVVGLVLALAFVAVALPLAPRSYAQAFDCSGNDWLVASTTEFEAAATCWLTASEPGPYSITLATDLTGSLTVQPRTADFSLTIDGAGRTVNDGSVRMAGMFDQAAEQQASPMTLRNLTIRSSLPTSGLAIAFASDVTVEDLAIFGGSDGIAVSYASATITRAQVIGVDPINPLSLNRARVVLQDSILEDTDDDPALYVERSALIVRNSIIRDANGLFEYGGLSEILFDRSAILDNDVNLLEIVSSYCCTSSTISYINSTYAQNDANAPIALGIGASEGSLVQVANSTVLTNGEFGLIGPVQTRSSLVDRCEHPDTFDLGDGGPWPANEFNQGPTDLGSNVGGCFGTPNLNHYPLDDYGCATPTPVGCVPTYATTVDNPARGAGQCADTIIPTSVDLFDIALDDLQPGTSSLLTTTGAQTIDGRGFARTNCDAGAYESDGSEPLPPTRLRVASLDVDHPLTNGNLPFDYGHRELADAIEAADIDVMMLQRVMKGPFGDQLTDQVTEELNRRGTSMLHDYATAYDSDPEFPDYQLYFGGQLILSRFPFTERGEFDLPNPDTNGLDTSIHWVLMETPNETIRLVNVRGHEDAPCTFVQELNNWLDDQPPLTTIVAGNLAADRPVGCVGEFAAGWVDACASTVAAPSCAQTVANVVDGQPNVFTNDYLLHRPVPGSSFALTGASVLPDRAAPFSDHLIVVADYNLVGGAVDADADGVSDAQDNCPTTFNEFQDDLDNDGVGDMCDPVLDGDANCDDTRDIIDALVVAQFDASVRSSVETCPLGDPTSELYAYGADANNDGTTDVIDALLIAQCSAGITNIACPPIPEAD